MSETTLIAALTKAQAKFAPIKRTKSGQQGNRRFMYAPLDEIIGATRPAMTENGLALISRIETNDTGAFVVTELRHAASDAVFTSRYPLTPGLLTQDRGKEITYARRYNTCALLDVVGEEGDTDDTGQADPSEAEAEASRKAAEERLEALKKKGNIKSAYDGKTLAPGEAIKPEDRKPADDKPAEAKPEPAKETKAEKSASDALAGIPAALADLMRRDKVDKLGLKAYYVSKGFLPKSVEPEAMPADFVTGLVANWSKALPGIRKAENELPV